MQSRSVQIVEAHAGLILNVVATSYDNGWTQLVDAIRKVLSGSRDAGLLQGLDFVIIPLVFQAHRPGPGVRVCCQRSSCWP